MWRHANVDDNGENINGSSSNSASDDTATMELTAALGRIISLHSAGNDDSKSNDDNNTGSNTYSNTDFIVDDGSSASAGADVFGTGQDDPPLSTPLPVKRFSGRHPEADLLHPSPVDRFPGLITPEQANKQLAALKVSLLIVES
jgi:hypothetical protein